MILPTYTDDKILKELMDDWPSVKRKAKSLAEKKCKELVSQGKGNEKALFDCYIRSKNQNKWFALILCRPKNGSKIFWSCRIHCVVERENGLRTIYFLRGLRFGPPYFVSINNHVLKRMRERFHPYEGKTMSENPNAEIAKILFHESEQPIFKRFSPPDMAKFIEGCADASEKSGLIFMRAAMLIAYRTDTGNYICKTFLNIDERFKKSKKFPYYLLMIFLYGQLNPKELADLGQKVLPLAQELGALEAAFPFMKPYIESAADGLYVLYL
jgi:hypothetical protein